MSVDVLGRHEDDRLEFKSAAALDDAGLVAREVVGMLNAGGGEIWIGVEEKDGQAVAVEPVERPRRAADRLRDFLLDALDPSPTPEEVTIEPRPAEADPAVLVVKVEPHGRSPYAYRKGGGWHFLRRVGARNHPMTRAEIFGQPIAAPGDEALQQAVTRLVEGRPARREPGLWLGLEPVRRLALDVQAERFRQLASEPALSGNRRTGWHFARSSFEPRPTADGIEWGLQFTDTGTWTARGELAESGALRFWVALERLHSKGEEREIWPPALLEYAVSAFRIARVVYESELGDDDRVAADLALLGVEGWGLREGTPGDYFLGNELSQLEEPDLIWEPVRFGFAEIEQAPDRCGFRLVRRVYQAFGFRESAMPTVYDRESGRLILPE